MSELTFSCEQCGSTTNVAHYKFIEQTGYVLLIKRATYQGVYCKPCAKKLLWKVQKHNILVGWIGIKAIVWNPFTFFGNFYRYQNPKPLIK